MSTPETLTLAAYFFVLIVLAIYGWHRYYLVYLYMKHRDREPQQGPPLHPLQFLRRGGRAERRLKGQSELLRSHTQPLGEQGSPNLLRQSLHMLQQLLTASLHMGTLLRGNRRGQGGEV